MKAEAINIRELFEGGTRYLVPVYQRPYSWEKENIDQLFDDMTNILKNNRKHFIGSIITIDPGSSHKIRNFNIIDGQQRITTLSLFIIAYIKSNVFSNENHDEIFENYLINKFSPNSDDYYKLFLIEYDRKIYEKIIKYTSNEMIEKLDKEEKQSKLYCNFLNLKTKIEASKMTIENFDKILLNITLVSIILNTLEEKKDSQIIFESINSTGLSLLKGDLIKNFLLMGQEREIQEKLYNDYWFELEKNLLKIDKLELFFKVYLIIKQKEFINEKKIYSIFKNYFYNFDLESDSKNEEIIKELYDYYLLFMKMIKNETGNKNIDKELFLLNSFEPTTTYPFILENIKKWKESKITEDDLKWIIKYTGSFIVRRYFCDLPSNALQKFFISSLKSLDENDYLNSFRYELFSFNNYQGMPKNNKFKERFINCNFYQMRKARNILFLLENFDNKNELKLESYTMEHILPQAQAGNLPEYWQKALGENWLEDWETYRHKIGNITFTAYNSEMSNKSFEDKLKITGGFKETNIRLNKYIVNQEKWTKEQILERSEELYKIAEEIWPFPELSQEKKDAFSSKKQESKTYNLDSYSFSNETKNLFKKLEDFLNSENIEYEIKYHKYYFNFVKSEKNIIFSIEPSQSKMKIWFNINKNIIDKKELIQDKSSVGHLTSGNSLLELSSENLEDALIIIKQLF